ncbi:hypothetical protein BDV96DRAFT_673934 [Lophiotrema nucula]|uniref:Uncharacterized protein n=1 Tax=Lophiotrema nucula TaxID=690887 RepID=A0A6A5YL94_9PLEO|nr:hypothetical protein BDV96DRAFT_673934 [Lophiotrema nucula]
MYTTFSSKSKQAAVNTYTNTAPRLPPAHNCHSVKVPSGNSWAGSHRDDKSDEPCAGYAHHAKDGNDSKDLPYLEQIIRKEKWERGVGPKPKTCEPIHNSNPTDRSSLESPNYKNNYPIHSQKVQSCRALNPTTQGAREAPIMANEGSVEIRGGHPNNSRSQTRETHTESTPAVEMLAGTNSKLVQKTMKLNPLSVTTERVHDESLNNDTANAGSSRLGKDGTAKKEPTRSPGDRECTQPLPHDKTVNDIQSDDGNACGSVRSPDEGICNISSGPTKLNKDGVIGVVEKKPTEVASDEGADDEFEKRQDDELQRKPPAFKMASDMDLPPVIVDLAGRLPKENESVGTRNGHFQTASQKDTTSAGVPFARLSNKMDLVSRLWKDQQTQNAPFENEASLRNTRALPQQIPRT